MWGETSEVRPVVFHRGTQEERYPFSKDVMDILIEGVEEVQEWIYNKTHLNNKNRENKIECLLFFLHIQISYVTLQNYVHMCHLTRIVRLINCIGSGVYGKKTTLL